MRTKLPARAIAFAAVCVFALACGRGKPAARVRVSPGTVDLGYPRCAKVAFDWQPLRPLDRLRGRPLVFVHLLDGPHNLVRTFDHELPAAWKPDVPMKYEIDLCQSALAPALRPGDYRLKIGLYDSEIGYRWPLDTGGEETGRRGYHVAKVDVPQKPEAPRFLFSGSWLPTETVEARQILARRWFAGSASMVVEGIDAPGEVRLDLHLPTGAMVKADCSDEPERAVAAGDQTVRVRVPSAPAEERCTIALLAGDAKGRGRLDLASWIPVTGRPTTR